MSLLSLIYTTLEYFSFFDFKRNLKVGLSAVGKMYIICAMLRNAHSCTYGSTTSTFFGVDPPSFSLAALVIPWAFREENMLPI